MSTITDITLHFNRQDFEELYFKNSDNKVLLSKNVKQQFILSIIAVVLLLASLIYSVINNKSWGIFTIVTLITVLIINQLIRKAVVVAKWKKSVNEFLNEQSKFVSNKISLAENTLTLKQDTNITIVRWLDFKKVVINDKSINLYGDKDFIFPKKSMTFSEFDTLRNEVLLRIKK